MLDVIETGIKVTSDMRGMVSGAAQGKKATDDLNKSAEKLNKTGKQSKQIDDELTRAKKRAWAAFDKLGLSIFKKRKQQNASNKETREATRLSKKQEQALKSQGKQAGKLSGIYRKLGAAMAVLGVAKISKGFVDVNSQLENYEVRLTTLLGSQTEANRLMNEMVDFASKVPFEFNEIAAAATQFAGVADGVDEVVKIMPLIGDLAATSGLSVEQTTEQVVRMFSAGAGSADLFRERGILAMLGFEAGATMSAERTRKKVIAEWEKTDSKFRGATERMASTWTGIMSMFGDRWTLFRKKVGDSGLFKFLKISFSSLLNDIDKVFETGVAQEFADFISNFVIAGIQILQSNIANVALGIRVWRSEIGSTGIQWSESFELISKWVAWVRDKVIELPINFAAMVPIWANTWRKIFLFAREVWTNITTDAEIAWSSVKRAAEVAGEGIGIFWANVIDEIKTIWAFMIDSFANGVDKLGFDDTAEGLRAYAQALSETATGADDALKKAAANKSEHEAMLVVLEQERAALLTQIQISRDAGDAAVQAALDERDAKIAALDAKRDAIKKTLEEQKALAKLKKTVDDLTGAENKNMKAKTAQLTESQKFVKKLEEELALMKFTGKELAVQTKLREAHAQGITDQDEAIRKLIESMHDLKDEQKDDAKETTDEVAQIYEDMASNIFDTFNDFWRDVIDGGKNAFKNIKDGILDIFKDLLADMATLAIAKPIIVPIVASIGGVLGLGSDAINQVLGQLGGAGGVGTPSIAGGSGGDLSGLLNNLPGGATAALGIAGGFLGGRAIGTGLGGTQSNSNLFSGIGTALGTAFGGPIGALIGGAVGGLVSGIFGGGKSVEATGLNLSIQDGQLSGNNFQDIAKRRSFFRGSRRYTTTSELDSELQAALQGSVNDIISTLSGIADVFGVNNNLESFGITDSRLDLTGLSQEQAEAAITEWLQGVTGEMAEHLFPSLDQLQESGEALFDTLQRVTNEILTMKNAAASLDATISAINAKYLSTPQEVLSDLEAQFNDLFNQAQTAEGEELLAIASMMQQLAPQLLEQSRAIYASGGPFHTLLNQVTDALAIVSSQLNTDAQDLIDNISAPAITPSIPSPNEYPYYPRLQPLTAASPSSLDQKPIILEQTIVYVAPDGTELKREVKQEILDESSRGEIVIDANGIKGTVSAL